MNDNWADPARTSLDPVDDFTADQAAKQFLWFCAGVVAFFAGVVAWLVYNIEAVARFALS
jgi:hypothetical protein